MPLTLTLAAESWPIAGSFAISRGAKTEAVVVVAELGDGKARGRGECVPYARYGESVESVMTQIKALAPRLAAGIDRRALQDAMPPGAARNALDCAFWDLEAKRGGRPAYALAGLPAPHALTTAYTISLAAPAAMAAAAAMAACRALLKVKLGAEGDAARIAAVRAAAPMRRSSSTPMKAGAKATSPPISPLARKRASSWSSSRCRTAATMRSRASSGRFRSAPTKARTTAPRFVRSPANTTRSTSSSTRPAA